MKPEHVCSPPFVVEHATPDRVRLRVEALRRAPTRAAAVARAAAAQPGVARAEARPTTGSLILRLDRGTTFEVALAAATRALSCEPPAEGAAPQAGASTRRRAAFGRSGWSEQVHGAHREHLGEADAPHAEPQSALLARLRVDPAAGLSEAEAAARLRAVGPNRAPQEAPASTLRLLGRQVSSLPVAMLGASAVISAATGGGADAVATLAVVAINATLGFVTEAQAERAIQSLIGDAGQSVETVRDGAAARVRAEHLVPGDVVVLAAGMQAPADARLLAARGLMVDEAALTGESEPVEKAPEDGLPPDAPLSARRNMLHAGTIVAAGSGRAVVVGTGAATEAARVQALAQGARRPPSPVESELDALGTKLAKLSLLACAAVLVAGRARGYPWGVILRDSLALAVAAVPEGLPMVATTTLSLGLKRMQRKGVLIRQLSAVESLGAVETICLDKTGTLTQNRMAVVDGALGLAEADPHARAPARWGRLAACAALNNDGLNGGASGTEAALLAFARAMGAAPEALTAARPRRATVERRPGRPWMATGHDGDGPCVMVKGAPEAVLALCDRFDDDGVDRPLYDAERAAILRLNDRLAARPARVLGFADGGGDAETVADRRDLRWLGMLALEDPIRPDARGFVQAMRAAGVQPVLITGDQGATARAVAETLGFADDGAIRVVDAGALADMPPALLSDLARDTHVFARVSPQQKLLIVRALQQAGRVVAMTGDGVNDGPALKAADVGVAMGASGADLAREVANVVIRDDRLDTLVEAVAQGRAIHRNIRRSVEFLVTTNLSEIVVGLVEAAQGPGALETPMELLWINLATDVLPSLGLALADPDPDVMRRPPRGRGEPIVPTAHFRRMARDGGMIAASALAAHFLGSARYGSGPRTRAMTFAALSLGQLGYTVVSQRSDPRHLRLDRLFENRTLDAALAVSILFALAPHVSPPLRRLLGIAPMGPGDAAIALAAAAAPTVATLARRGVALRLTEREIARP